MYHVSTQGIDELMINVHYYYIHQRDSSNLSLSKQEHIPISMIREKVLSNQEHMSIRETTKSKQEHMSIREIALSKQGHVSIRDHSKQKRESVHQREL